LGAAKPYKKVTEGPVVLKTKHFLDAKGQPNQGVTFPMLGTSHKTQILEAQNAGQIPNLPVSLTRDALSLKGFYGVQQ